MIDLAELQMLEAVATPTPWAIRKTPFNSCIDSMHGFVIGSEGMAAYGEDAQNADFICAARNALPTLLAELTHLRALAAAVQAHRTAVDSPGGMWDSLEAALAARVMFAALEEWEGTQG